jgi:hypothetical protein
MFNRPQQDNSNPAHVVIYIAQSTIPWNTWWDTHYGCPSPAVFSFTPHHPVPARHVWLPGGEQQLITPHWSIIAISETDMQSVNPYPLDPHNKATVHSNWSVDTHSGATTRLRLDITPRELRALMTDGTFDLDAFKTMLALTQAPTSVFEADHWVDLFRTAINNARTAPAGTSSK